ncbi:MAG: sulfatase-like hydrolase/transferase, partial [Vicinamibacteria bacterium]|nr:sulfatase-like hydrolase/transferase [Vicinamibacteria bacterium]
AFGVWAIMMAGPWRRASRFSRPPIVLISVDTLRADHLPAYGYKEVQTPHLDAFRRDAILYANAYSPVPLTLPAHVSLLTGLWPTMHRVRDNLGYRFDGRAHASLPRILSGLGYATGGFVSAYVLRGATGLGEIFDEYDDEREPPPPGAPPQHVERGGFKTMARARRWLSVTHDRPFFLFVHIFEPHAPYAPPAPYANRYRLAYDGEIAASDAILGELLKTLRESGLYDSAVIVFLSDHGEGLGQHGEKYHGVLLYRWAVHVPLMIKLPGSRRAGETVTAPVSLIDVAPTLAEVARAKMPGDLPGRSLLAPGNRDRSLYCETYYPRVHLGWNEQRGIIGDRYHYVEGPTPELFDVVSDPAETENLSTRESDVARDMAVRLAAFTTTFTLPERVESEDAERLAALGYVDRVAASVSGPLPDPRRSIHLLDELNAAFKLTAEGMDEEGVGALRAIVARQPRLFDAWYEMAQALARLERFREAHEAYVAAKRASPSLAGPATLGLSLACLELGRVDEAEAHARASLSVHPAQAHELLARVALARDRLEDAEREARQAVGDAVAEINAQLLRAEIRIRRGDFESALAVLEKTRARVASGETRLPRDLDFLTGDALARLDRKDEAEAAFRREIRAFPRNARAYVRLAIVVALQGRARHEVDGVIESMVSAHPAPETMRLAVEAYESLGNDAAANRWRKRMSAFKANRGD